MRKASVMKVYREHYAEYKRRHDELWPEMEKELKAHGASNYSIFLDEETGTLFAYLEVENEEKWNAISESPVVQKWWTYMEDIMETNTDASPVSKELKKVFYLP